MSGSALATLPGILRDGAGPVFRAPWEAQAFALAVALHARGCFAWQEFADRLGTEIALASASGTPDDGSRYYEWWLGALEKLTAEKGLVTPAELRARKDAWDAAARATPHGKPIELRRTW
jgi:nitrile hydratase accessory protein